MLSLTYVFGVFATDNATIDCSLVHVEKVSSSFTSSFYRFY